jgi:hypothetical protein
MQKMSITTPTRAPGLHSDGRTGKSRVQTYFKKGTGHERRKTEYG